MLSLEHTSSRMSHLARQEIYFQADRPGRDAGERQPGDGGRPAAGRPGSLRRRRAGGDGAGAVRRSEARAGAARHGGGHARRVSGGVDGSWASEDMTAELTVLGSGSSGNATLVAAGGDRVLIDAGLSYRAIRQRLERLGVAPDSLRGIVITHAHVDHVRGAALLSGRHGITVHATPSARETWGPSSAKVSGWGGVARGSPGRVRGLAVFAVQRVPRCR